MKNIVAIAVVAAAWTIMVVGFVLQAPEFVEKMNENAGHVQYQIIDTVSTATN